MGYFGSYIVYKRVRDLREDHDLTQTEISEILHCSQRVYSNYERGEIETPTSVLIAPADYYNVSVDYILERTDKSTLPKERQIHIAAFLIMKNSSEL